MGQRLRSIMTMLDEGPATSREIAAETGLSVRHTAVLLGMAYRQGVVERKRAPMCRGDEQRGQVPYLYSVRGAPFAGMQGLT